MLFNTVINIDTSTSMIHNISTSALCLLLLLLLFMIHNTLNNIANSNAGNGIITPSTTIILEISMINATIPSIIVNTGINRCRAVVTTTRATITVTVVVTIITITMIAVNTIMIIIADTRLSLLLLLTFF